MATKNTILGTVPKSRGRYTEGDITTKWYYDNILEYKGSSFRCISKASTGITGAPATYNSGTHTLVPKDGWEFFVDTTGALDVEERLTENEKKLSELENKSESNIQENNFRIKGITKENIVLINKEASTDARLDVPFRKSEWYTVENIGGANASCFLYKKENGEYTELQVISSVLIPNQVYKFRVFQDADAIGGYSSSIPYTLKITRLSNTLGEIYANERIEDMREMQSFSIPIDEYEHGGLSYGEDDAYLSNVRCRPILPLIFPFDVVFTAQARKINCFYYDNEQTFVRETGWVDESVYVPKNTYFRFVVWNNKLTDSSVEELIDGLVYYNVDKYLSQCKTNGEQVTLNRYYFEKGSLNQGQNDTYLQQARCRTRGSLKFDFDVVIRPNDRHFGVEIINDSGSFITGSGWKTSEYLVKAGNRFRLLIAYRNDDTQTRDLSWLINGVSLFCIKSDSYIQSRTPNVIWACREGSITETTTPPNSKYGIFATAKNEYDRVRCTIRKTTDGQFVLIHDNTINNIARNLDGSVISTPIQSDSLSLAQLNEYDWGIKYDVKYRGLGVPTLQDFLYYASIANIGVTLEFNFNISVSDIESIMKMCVKYGLTQSLYVVIQGVPSSVISYIVQNYPSVSFFACITFEQLQSRTQEFKEYIGRNNELCWVYAPWGDIPTEEQVLYAKQNGFLVGASNVFSFDDIINKVIGKGFDIVECANVYNIKTSMRNYLRNIVGE